LHEASIAQSLVELIVDELAARSLSAGVASVRVRIGTLSSIVPAALISAFKVARRHTALKDAELEIDLVEPLVWCPNCQAERAPIAPPRLCCRVCGQRCPELIQGRELDLAGFTLLEDKSIHDHDHGPAAAHP
jgi:hydrogenase nickel incorporation protein HypA/HybF